MKIIGENMLNSLEIKNFRVFEELKVHKLGHVNLIVGKNNSGKSTVLEALRIYCASNTSEALLKIAQERGEPTPQANTSDDLNDDAALAVLKSNFSNRKFDFTEQNSKLIKIGSNDSKYLFEFNIETIKSPEDAFRATNPNISKEQAKAFFEANIGMYAQFEQVVINSLFSLTSRRGSNIQSTRLDKNGGRQTSGSLGAPLNHAFVPTTLLSFNDLAKLLVDLELTEYKKNVLETLKLFDPAIEDYGLTGLSPQIAVSLRLKDNPMRVPLKSMGEGIAKVFQLMLSIPQAKDGFLLIDEFENGIHYSIQERVWNLIFKLASEFNIQVFATTHSWDCIEAFAKVAKERPEDGILFRVAESAKPSDAGKTIAIEYSEDDLLTMTKSNFEVR
jgi:predicted ATPase